jgi:SAM-dependent methyltransferase
MKTDRVVADSLPGNSNTTYGTEYLQWKDWGGAAFGALSRHERAKFSAIFRHSKIDFPSGSPALDIGFGNGTFLTYGSERGWKVEGTEANPALVECARQMGFHALHTEDLACFPDDTFDLVTAFEVLEHISQENLPRFLVEIKRILRHNGVFVANFPNGDSPFGRYLQHGDVTHLTTIGSHMAEYWGRELHLDTIHLGGEAQPLWDGMPGTFYRLLEIPMRSLLNSLLNFLFSPHCHISYCSPNLVWIFRVEKLHGRRGKNGG